MRRAKKFAALRRAVKRAAVEASERPLKNSVRVKVNNEHDAWVNGKAVRPAAEHETAVAWGLVNLMRVRPPLAPGAGS